MDKKENKSTPKSNRPKNLPLKATEHFSGQTSECQPKVFVKTFGCQMNVRDSEVITGLLTTDNWKLTSNQEEADVIIFNTCSVRQHAEDKVWSEIGRYRKVPLSFAKAKLGKGDDNSDNKIVGVIGCMAQNYKEEIFRRAPQVDFVVGPSDIAKIPQIIEKIVETPACRRGRQNFASLLKIWEADGEKRPEEIYHTGFYQDDTHAYVVISEGCSNFCSYCVVPYVRGNLRNRNYQDILKEIEEAAARGITKITLLGQNVNAYVSRPKTTGQRSDIIVETQNFASLHNFVDLLDLISNVKGINEIGFVTSHPKDIDFRLFDLMAKKKNIKKYLHLPVQSGSNRILELMNRQYTREDYLKLAEDYKKIVGGGLTTDFIVGFPSETEEDFKQSLDLMKQIEFNAAFIFKYSPRPHTEAENLDDDVPRKEKERRHKILLDTQKEISFKIKP